MGAGHVRGGLVVGAIVCAIGAGGGAAAQAATYYVNTPADSADGSSANCATVHPSDIPAGAGTTCTLRAAITAAATGGGANTIDFVVCGPYVIKRQLPHIPGQTTLNGLTVGTYDSGCTDIGAGSTNYGYANIQGQGNTPGAAAGFPGLILDGSGSVVTFVDINGFTQSIELGGTGNHHIFDDAIGADPFEQGALAGKHR